MGLMRVVNLAHGAFAAIGGYLAMGLLIPLGMPFGLAIVVAVIAVAAFSIAVERLLYVHLYGASELDQVLLTVGITALVIHLTWSYAARRNVAEVVGQLNLQIVGSVQHEIRATLNDAWSVQEAVRSIFFQEAIKPTDEAKREFIFLALLRSHPTLSWIAIGFPDGGFFGSLRAADDEIDMVEVKRDRETGVRQQRVDTYMPQSGDVLFRGREITPSDFDATAQTWYKRAVAEDGPGWSMLSHLPYRDRPAIVTSTPIMIDLDFSGVIAVVVELERLSQFLAGLHVGKTGTVVVLNRSGTVVASAASASRRSTASSSRLPSTGTIPSDASASALDWSPTSPCTFTPSRCSRRAIAPPVASPAPITRMAFF